MGRGPYIDVERILVEGSRFEAEQSHCAALLCRDVHCSALLCIASYCFASLRIALHCFALLCIDLHCFSLFCTAAQEAGRR